jgi:hypothetical protein
MTKEDISNAVSRRKVPYEYHAIIYDMYASKISVAEIRNKLIAEHDISITERSIYTIITEVRNVRRAALKELLQQAAVDDEKGLKWLQNEIMAVCEETRFSDKQLFLKAADRLLEIFRLKANINGYQKMKVVDNTEQIKAEWISQLQGALTTANQNKKD